jgi:uncharacterized membrane protein
MTVFAPGQHQRAHSDNDTDGNPEVLSVDPGIQGTRNRRQVRPVPLEPGRAARERLTPEVPASLTHRVVVLLGVVGLFGPALAASLSIVDIPLVGSIAAAICAAAVVLAAFAMIARRERVLERIDGLVLAVAVVVLGAWTASQLYFHPAYGTDEAAFVQYAAQLFLHGHNPYTANLLPALTRFRVPITFATYRLNGTMASRLAYPALSFLLVAPLVVLTHGVQSVILANMLALGVEMVLLYRFLPKPYRVLSVVLVIGMPYLFNNTIGGVVATTLTVPFLLAVSHRWTSIGSKGRLGSSGVQKGIFLGLAVSAGQFAWFIVPFLVVAVLRLRAAELGWRRASVVVTRFVGCGAAVGLLVNTPFIVWSPHAFFADVLSPLFQKAVPLGQGLIDATIFLHIGGGDLDYFTAAAITLLAALLVAHSVYFSHLARATFVLPSLVFLLSTRALSEYFVLAVGVWVVSAVVADFTNAKRVEEPEQLDVGSPRADPLVRKKCVVAALRGSVVGASLLAVLLFVCLALTAGQPLTIRIRSLRTNGEFQAIWRIRARVANHSKAALVPHFTTDASGYVTGFWNVIEGPRRLQPGEKATYVLAAPNVGSMPRIEQSFLLQAVTASPDTMSSSRLLIPKPFACTIVPNHVNRVLAPGHSVELSVRLRSPFGALVHQRGVRVELGQIIYGQSQLVPAEARIDGAPEGQTPVERTTNSQGEATFRITDSSPQGEPLYFQAWAVSKAGYQFGYSEVVDVLWAGR